MKLEKWNCKVCWIEFSLKYLEKFNYICPHCINKQSEVKQEKVITEESQDTFKWLKLYTAYYLNSKLNYNFKSIKNEVVCIKYKDKYILKEDIINQFNQTTDY
jgi:hypothetical protein